MATTAGSGDAWRISGEDRAKHDSQFFTLKPINGFITGEQARGFFMQSGLPTPVLGQIWGLADMNNDGKMDKKEFSIAMHLIKKRLQGYELPKSLPPQLKADPSPPVMGSFGTMPVTSTQPGMAMGGMGPNMGLPGGMGMGPRMPMMANGMPHMVPVSGYIGGQVPIQPGGFAGGVPVRTGTPPTGAGNMSIPHNSKLKYTQLFNSHDRNKRGSLTGVEARSILVQTGVPQQMLAQIWNLSDIDKDGRLDCEEFCIALHLTDLVKMGQALPARLPPELLAAKGRSGSFGSPVPMAAPGIAPPQKDNFGDLLGSMGMAQPVQPVSNGEAKQEEPQDLTTFEDKRKLNFDKGQAELERRRQQLQEQMRRENEERLEKERKEQEKRDKHRQEQEMKRQQELEKQLEKQRAIEREKEEHRRKMMEQREAARRELERQRQMEWERQRKEQLMIEKAREYEQLSALKSQSSNLKGELELLQGKKSEFNGKISQVKNGVTDYTAHIEAMRSTRDLKNKDIDRLQRELQELNQKLHAVQSDRETLDLRVQTSIQSNPMSETHRTMMHSVELKKTSVQKLKKDLEQLEKDTGIRLAEIDNLNTQFKELNATLTTLQADISKAQKQSQDSTKQYVEDQARLKKDKDKHEKLRKELEAQRKKEESMAKPAAPEPAKAAADSSGGGWAAFGGDTAAPATASTDNWASVFDAQGGEATNSAINWGANTTSQTSKATIEAKSFKLSGPKKKYQALYQFDSRNEDELTLTVGDTVMVFDDQTGAEPGWKGGEINGTCGWFPEAYVERVEEESSQGQNGPSTATDTSHLTSHEDSSFMTVPVKIPAVSPTPGQGHAAPAGLQAQALYPWKAKKENHLTFNKGDIISVQEQQDMWWSGDLNGKVGWFPKSYVKLISGPSAVTAAATSSGTASPVVTVTGSPPAANGIQSPVMGIPTGEPYVSVYWYQSTEPGDLTFNTGEIINVIKSEGDWWTGSIGDKTGIFPANYVKKYDQPQPTQQPPDLFGQPAASTEAGPDTQPDKSPVPDISSSLFAEPSDNKAKVNSPFPDDPFSDTGSMTNTPDTVGGMADVFKSSDPFSDTSLASGFNSSDSGVGGHSPFPSDPFAEFGKTDNIEPNKEDFLSNDSDEVVKTKVGMETDGNFTDPFKDSSTFSGASPDVGLQSNIEGTDSKPFDDTFASLGGTASPSAVKDNSKSDSISKFDELGGLFTAGSTNEPATNLDFKAASKQSKDETNSEPFTDMVGLSTAVPDRDETSPEVMADPFASFTSLGVNTSGDKSEDFDLFAGFGDANINTTDSLGDSKSPFGGDPKSDPSVELAADPFASFTAASASTSNDKADDPFEAFGNVFSSDTSLSGDPFAGSEDMFASTSLSGDPFANSEDTFATLAISSPADNLFHDSSTSDLGFSAPVANPFCDSPSSLVNSIEADAGTSLPQNLDFIQGTAQNPASCDSSIQTSASLFNLSSLEDSTPQSITDVNMISKTIAPPVPVKESGQKGLNKLGLDPAGDTETPTDADPSMPSQDSSEVSPGGHSYNVMKAAPGAGAGGASTLKKPEIATVIAPYSATGEEQLSLNPGQLIQVRKKSASGWWEGELQARGQKRKIGWFPANYVKLLQASARNTPDNMLANSGNSSPAQAVSGNSPSPMPATSPPSQTYADHVIALYPYTAQNSDELTFQKDAVINVIKKDDPDWWSGELNGQTGMFPSNYVQSASPEATSWSTDPQVLALTSKMEGRRQSAIKELIDTEETFMVDMSIVLEAFYKPLQKSGAMTEEQLTQIFVNWKELIVCNTKLQKALRVRKKMCGGVGQVINSIGDILCENIPHLTPYIRFCSCQLNAAALLQKISETNPKFQEIHKKCVQNPKTKGMPLSSFLLKPMQRITKYPLIVEKILTYTPEDHPDRSHLLEALEHCQELCSQVNEGVREKENSDRLEWIQQHVHCDGLPEKITFNSVTNCLGPRKLLHNGVVYKTKSNKELGAFLFNDFLLLTTSNRPLNSNTHNLFDTTGSVQYRMYKLPIVLNEVMIKKSADDKEAFSVAHIDRLYNLRCHSHSERDTWVKRLDTASRQYLDTERKKREKAISSPKISQGVGRLLVIILDGSNLVCSKDVRRTPGVGRLLVVIIEGKDLQACDDHGKSDPYCEVSMGAQEHKTKVIQNTLSPKWNASMQFIIRDLNMDSLCITVFDRDLFSPNDFLGRTEIRVKDIMREANQQQGRGPIVKKLLLHEVPTGEVTVKLDLHLFE